MAWFRPTIKEIFYVMAKNDKSKCVVFLPSEIGTIFGFEYLSSKSIARERWNRKKNGSGFFCHFTFCQNRRNIFMVSC